VTNGHQRALTDTEAAEFCDQLLTITEFPSGRSSAIR
jgi:hypothetical protein